MEGGFLDIVDPEYIKKYLKNIELEQKKRIELVKKIVSIVISKELHVDINTEVSCISVHSHDFKFNSNSYFSKELHDCKSCDTVPLTELLELVKKYKKQAG